MATKVEQIQCRNDHAYGAIMQELQGIRGKYTQVHCALSDDSEFLGQANVTMRDAKETIQLMQETKGFGKGRDRSRLAEERHAV